jgi:hypothetical protein
MTIIATPPHSWVSQKQSQALCGNRPAISTADGRFAQTGVATFFGGPLLDKP